MKNNPFQDEFAPPFSPHAEESLDQIHQRQAAFRALNTHFNGIEGNFHNLQQTVPPHARDWWDQVELPVAAKVQRAREELNALSLGDEGPTNDRSHRVGDLLSQLTDELEALQEDLGRRTAAGRARESRSDSSH